TITDQIGQARTSLRVRHRADHPPGLVQREVDRGRAGRDAHPVDFDDHALWVNPPALLQNELAIDLDPPLSDHLLARATTAQSGCRENLLQTNLGLVDV